MKNQLSYFVLLFVLLSSCGKKTYTALYQGDGTIITDKTQYQLSKTLLKLDVIYTVNEPRVFKNGVDQALTTSTTKITIEDPIKMTKLLVADPSQTFVTTGHLLPEALFVNAAAHAKSHVEGETISVPSEPITTNETLRLASLTDSSIEAEAYASVLKMKDNIDKVTTKEDAELALNIVFFYKSQFTMINEDFKPYVKKTKLKYTIIIDPTELYSEEGRWSNTQDHSIFHTIYPKHIFKNRGILNTILTLEFPKPEVSLLPELENKATVEGVVYRLPSKANFTVALNDTFVASDALGLAQLGAVKMVSLKDLEKMEGAPAMFFKPNAKDDILKFEEKLVELDFDSSATIEASQMAIKSAYAEKLKNIDLLIESLQERKNELE
ncbi:hypothetical protein [Winogradskyella sp. PC D3.3]